MAHDEILRQIVEKLENLDQAKQNIQDDIKDVLSEAKSQGLNIKILRKVLQIRKMKPDEALEEEELVHLYLEALRRGKQSTPTSL